MRTLLIAGNWKMNGNQELMQTMSSAINHSEACAKVEVVLCPPSVYLGEFSNLADGFAIGAQNMHQEQKGAFTGELSSAMLKHVGCSYVILGHSERRALFGETDELVASKVKSAVDSGLKAILCVGETLDERESGCLESVIKKQVEVGCSKLDPEDFSNLVVAYEPVWAIGTGKTASPEQAQQVHDFIRSLLSGIAGDQVASTTSILYGGSMNAENAESLLSQNDIDGGLIGGASLKPEEFLTICEFAANLNKSVE